MFLSLAGAEVDLKQGLVAAQIVQTRDLCQSGLYYAPTFIVNIPALPTDLQCLLKGRLLILGEEEDGRDRREVGP